MIEGTGELLGFLIIIIFYFFLRIPGKKSNYFNNGKPQTWGAELLSEEHTS